MLANARVKLVGSVETEVQATFWPSVLASQVAFEGGSVMVAADADATRRRAAEKTEKARIILAGRGGRKW
jgi:hypothetical protein